MAEADQDHPPSLKDDEMRIYYDPDFWMIPEARWVLWGTTEDFRFLRIAAWSLCVRRSKGSA